MPIYFRGHGETVITNTDKEQNMKLKNQRTIKVTDDTHRIASRLASKYDLSISGLLNILIRNAMSQDVLTISAKRLAK
jgi:replication initiation and membrane attachment protein DnaB